MYNQLSQKLYNFKQKVEDFQVEEILHQYPEWSWDVFFVFFEKQDKNTMFIVDLILKKTWLLRKDIWIAWLKDKQAITRQRISIYKSKLDKIGGKEFFLNILSKEVKILESQRWKTPLCVWSNKWNKFKITLRNTKYLNEKNITELQSEIKNRVEYIQKNWFPNCFWTQRFGKWNRNFHLSKKVFEEWISDQTDNAFHIRFKLQAYASMYFNNYALQRYNKWQYFLDWDIIMDWHHAQFNQIWIYKNWKAKIFDYRKCKSDFENKDFFYPDFFEHNQDSWFINPDDKKRIATWPMLWYNLVLPENQSKAFLKERAIIKQTNFLTNWIKIAKKYNIWWIRRPIFVYPENLQYQFDNFNLILEFTLPVWSYATTLIGWLFKEISPKTCQENWLIIPTLE